MAKDPLQWELVTKPRKQSQLEQKITAANEQKRNALMGPKLEELLPDHKLRKLNKGSGRNSPVTRKSKSNSPKNKANPKPAKQPGNEQPKSQKVTAKVPPKPKNLNLALSLLDVADFQAHLAGAKTTSPASKAHWLKFLTSYLNGALPYDCDPTFSGKPIDYPSKALPTPFRNELDNLLTDIGQAELEYYQPLLLESMAADLNNNLHIIGYKIVLQLIGQKWPSICTTNLAQKALMRNSYQNNSAAYLSILWAHGQGGYYALTEGVRVWANLMLPSLELKNYTKFVVEYIEKVLTVAKTESINFNQDEFFKCYYSLRGSYINIPKELQQSLKRSSALLLHKYIKGSSKHANIFLSLLRNIESASKQSIEIEACIKCLLQGEEDCLRIWRMNYKKQQTPSRLLLQAIDGDWQAFRSKLRDFKAFVTFLNEVQTLNEELSTKKNERNVEDLKLAVQVVQDKARTQPKRKQNATASSTQKSGSCKWIFGIFLLLGLIVGTITYDIRVYGNGQLEHSNLGNALKKAGVLPQVEQAWFRTVGASARFYMLASREVPVYVAPAAKAVVDLSKIAINAGVKAWSNTSSFLAERWSALSPAVESRLPGLIGKVELSYAAVIDRCVKLYANSLSYIQTYVLVGKFSPENISSALNETRNAALVYYERFHQNVDAYARL